MKDTLAVILAETAGPVHCAGRGGSFAYFIPGLPVVVKLDDPARLRNQAQPHSRTLRRI